VAKISWDAPRWNKYGEVHKRAREGEAAPNLSHENFIIWLADQTKALVRKGLNVDNRREGGDGEGGAVPLPKHLQEGRRRRKGGGKPRRKKEKTSELNRKSNLAIQGGDTREK